MRKRALATAIALVLAAPVLAVQPEPLTPPTDIRLLDGRMLKAGDLRGKVVVKLFWASWSPASVTAVGALDDLQTIYGPQGLTAIALSIDESERAARDSVRVHGYRIPVAMRSDALFERYGRVETTPAHVIIDRSGAIRYRGTGALDAARLQAKIAALLAEPAPMTLSGR